jgi:hypothetical protein
MLEDLEALYHGGKCLKERYFHLIPPPMGEKKEITAKKQKIALDSYNNYFAQVCNYYPGHLFSYPLELRHGEGELPEYYEDFSENCDNIGTNFVDWERYVLTETLVYGRHLTEIVIPDSEATNRIEWEEMGEGNLYLRGWEAEQILDWMYDDIGKLEWVKLYSHEHVRPNPLGNELTKHTWVIIDRISRQTFQIYLEKDARLDNDKIDVPLIENQEHNLGFVPVVDLMLPKGIHLGEHLRGPAISNWRGRSATWWALQAQAYSVPVIKSSGDLSGLASVGAIQIPTDADFAWSNPPPDFIKSLQEWNDDTKNEIYRVGSRLSYNSTDSSYALVRSAQARVEDKKQDHTTMKDFGIIIKEHAKSILDIISKIRKDNLEWTVKGFEHLENMQLPDIAAIADVLSKVDFAKIGAISETYAKQLKIRISELTFQDADEKLKNQMRKEIDEMEIPEIENKTNSLVTTQSTMPAPNMEMEDEDQNNTK